MGTGAASGGPSDTDASRSLDAAPASARLLDGISTRLLEPAVSVLGVVVSSLDGALCGATGSADVVSPEVGSPDGGVRLLMT